MKIDFKRMIVLNVKSKTVNFLEDIIECEYYFETKKESTNHVKL